MSSKNSAIRVVDINRFMIRGRNGDTYMATINSIPIRIATDKSEGFTDWIPYE